MVLFFTNVYIIGIRHLQITIYTTNMNIEHGPKTQLHILQYYYYDYYY